MIPEQVYLFCALARQLLSEATGTDWSHADAQQITSAAPSMEAFVARWDFHRIYPHGLKITKGVTGNDPDHTLADCPVKDEPHFIHYIGVPKKSQDGAGDGILVTWEGGSVRLALTGRTKVEPARAPHIAPLHILATQDLEARYFLSTETYESLQYYYGNQLCEDHIDSFLELNPQTAAFLHALATDPEIRRSLLYGLSYLAGVVLQQETPICQESQAQILSRFHQEAAPAVSCQPLLPAWFALGAQILFGQFPLHWAREESRFPQHHLMTLGVFAIAGGIVPTCLKGESPVSVLLDFFQKYRLLRSHEHALALLPSDRLSVFVDGILAMKPETEAEQDILDRWLFHLLVYHPALPQAILERICHTLFLGTINTDQLKRFQKLLDGPNGSRFEAYILKAFHEGADRGMAHYHFCAASVLNTRRAMGKEDPVLVALNHMVEAQDDTEFLINSLCLSMLAWHPRAGGQSCHASLKQMELSPEIISRLTGFLSHTENKLHFTLAASAIHDLAIEGFVKCEELPSFARSSALAVLSDPDAHRRAEELLSIIPLPDAIFCEDHFADLAKDYLSKFADSLEDPDCKNSPEVLFATVCHLGGWPSQEARWDALNRICRYYNDHSKHILEETSLRMDRYIARFAPYPQPWPMHSTHTVPENLGKPLQDWEQAFFTDLALSLEASEEPPYVVKITYEALRLLDWLKAKDRDESELNRQKIESVLRNTRLEIPAPGSYVVVSWFRLLCSHGCAEQALECYQQYKDILDMPDSVMLGSLFDDSGFFRQHRNYLQSRSRVAAALFQGLGFGHLEPIRTFLNSQYRELVDGPDFAKALPTRCPHALLTQLSELYEGRHGLDSACRTAARYPDISHLHAMLDKRIAELEEQSPVPPTVSSRSFYDDKTVIQYILLQDPDSHSTVFSLGYGHDYDLVKLAVSRCGKSLAYASSTLRQSRELCLLALENSGYALPYVCDSLLEEYDLVKSLLLKSEFTLEDMPEPYLSDRELITAAITRDPKELEHTPQWARADRAIVELALRQPLSSKCRDLPIRYVDPELTKDKALMLVAVRANPHAFSYVSPQLQKDPDILALPHKRSIWDILDEDFPWP